MIVEPVRRVYNNINDILRTNEMKKVQNAYKFNEEGFITTTINNRKLVFAVNHNKYRTYIFGIRFPDSIFLSNTAFKECKELINKHGDKIIDFYNEKRNIIRATSN